MSAWGDSSVPSDASTFSIVYREFGLAPPHKCETSYVVSVEPGGAVACGWESDCPDKPKRQKRPALNAKQLSSLKALVERSGFFKLDDFNSNHNIIDGGMEVLEVRLDRRKKRVEMANTGARAFAQVRDQLFHLTSCDPGEGR